MRLALEASGAAGVSTLRTPIAQLSGNANLLASKLKEEATGEAQKLLRPPS